MSSVTSGNRLPKANLIDREAPDHSWSAYVLSGALLTIALCLAAKYGLAALMVLSDALRGWAGLS